MKKSSLLLLLLPYLLAACSPRVSTVLNAPQAPLEQHEQIRVIGITEPVPPGAERIGTLKITDSGFSVNCGWDVVIEQARSAARKAGGNAIKITDHRRPDLASTCHRIAAIILRVNPEAEVIAESDSYFKKEPVAVEEYAYEAEYPKVRLGVNGGWSSRIAPISDNVQPDLKQYIKELKKGYNFGADATYFVSEQMGIGLKYNNFRASNAIDIHATSPNGVTGYGKMSDQIAIGFVGPTLMTRYLDQSRKNALYTSFSIGYMSYLNNSRIINDKFKITSGTVGLACDIGYDMGFGMGKNTALGFQLSVMTGALSNYNLTTSSGTQTITLDKDNMESLARIDLSVGLRFIK